MVHSRKGCALFLYLNMRLTDLIYAKMYVAYSKYGEQTKAWGILSIWLLFVTVPLVAIVLTGAVQLGILPAGFVEGLRQSRWGMLVLMLIIPFFVYRRYEMKKEVSVEDILNKYPIAARVVRPWMIVVSILLIPMVEMLVFVLLYGGSVAGYDVAGF